MRSGRAGVLLLLVSVTLALLLQLMALPDWMRSSRPYWVPMVLSYFALTQPGGALLVLSVLAGLGLDVAFGTALGQHAHPELGHARPPGHAGEPQPQPLSQTRRRAWSPPVHHLAGDMEMISHPASDVEPCGCSLASLSYFQR